MPDNALFAKQLLDRAAKRLDPPVDAEVLYAVEADLDDSVSALDAAGYRVQPEVKPNRGLSLRELQLRLYDLSDAPDIVGQGVEVEELRATVQARLGDAGSAVLDRYVAALASGVTAPPLRERLATLEEALPYGKPDAGDETRRAVDLAFRAALDWTREAASAAGEEAVAAGIASLRIASASYIVSSFRETYIPELPAPEAAAAEHAAAAVEAAQELDSGYDEPAALRVAENAAAALRPLLQRDATRALELARGTVSDLIQPRALPTRDLS